MNQNIMDDLKEREVTLVSVIVETKDGKLQVIAYDDNGSVKTISREVAVLRVNEVSIGAKVIPMYEIKGVPQV